MDYATYDNDTNPSDDDYFAFVIWLTAQTAHKLRQAKGNSGEQKRALCIYYQRGTRANLTPGELLDFLAASTPSILADAGYDDAEADALFTLHDTLTDAAIAQVTLPDTA